MPRRWGRRAAVASRFVHRLEQRVVAGGARWEAARRWAKTIHFANELDRPQKGGADPAADAKTASRSAPSKLSVTAIEDWLRDPYTIYAKHILKLEPLDPVDMPLSTADRGSAIHDALERSYASPQDGAAG